MGDGRVVGDELMIEVGEVKEGMYFLDFHGGRPGSDTIKLDRVHSKLSWFHDHSEVFDLGGSELTLLKS